MMIVCGAHVVILSQYRKEMLPWYLLIGFCLLIAIYRSFFTGALEMKAFRDGKRPATIMHQLAKGYTDPQIELIADYFSRQSPARWLVRSQGMKR